MNIEPCAVCGSVASRASQHYSWCSSLECEMNKVSLSPALWNRIQVALREQAARTLPKCECGKASEVLRNDEPKCVECAENYGEVEP